MVDFKPSVPKGLPPAIPSRPQRERSRTIAEERESLWPTRASINSIPTPEALQRLIQRALQALSSGIYWDRGSIINIVI
jgi:hypothetical protein